MSRRLLAAGLTLLPLLCGCATAGSAASDTGTDLQAIQARILELQRKAAIAEVEIARLRQQVAALEARGVAPGQAAAPAAPSRTVSEPPSMLAPSAPQIEVQDLGEPPVAAPSSGAPPTAAPAAAIPVDAAGQAAYDEAYALFHQGRYVDAESSFQRFLQGYPRTELTDNAFYWIGESRFARGDVRGALAAFRQTVETYPQGNKVPDALLKAGQCLQALGDADAARASFEEILHRFPESAAAVVARERLEAMP